MVRKAPAVIALMFLLAACSNPLPPEKTQYAGEWRSEDMALWILADGRVAYKRKSNGAWVSVNGPIKEFRGDDFSVGILFFTTTFVVTDPPREVNGQWQMVVDGVRLTRVR